MKLLLLIPHIGSGGDWVVVKDLVKHWHGKGMDITLMAANAPESIDGVTETIEAPLQGSIKKLPQNLAVIFRLDTTYDVIYGHSPNTLLFGWLIKKLRSSRSTLAMTCHWPVQEGRFRTYLKRWIFRRADCIHCLSIKTRKDLIDRYKVPENKLFLAHLGIRAEKFHPLDKAQKSAARIRFGMQENLRHVGFAGRLNPEKNVNWILEAARKARTDLPDLRFWIAGDGPMGKELRAFVREHQLEDTVTFMGRVEDMRAFYNAINLLVLPSRFEAFPLVIAEAAFCSCPSLRSNTEGAEDQIQHGQTGFIFDINSGVTGLYAMILHAFETGQHLSKMGKRANEHLSRISDFNEYTNKLESRFFPKHE